MEEVVLEDDGEESVEVVEADVVVAETEAGSVEVDMVVAWSISQPDMPYAPTLELLCRDVVKVVYVPDCVDAYVNVWPDVTSDTQNPTSWPSTALCR